MAGDNLLDDALLPEHTPGREEALQKLFDLWRGLQWNRRDAYEALQREFLGSASLYRLYQRDLERLLGRSDVDASACVQLALTRLTRSRRRHHFESGKYILAWLRDRKAEAGAKSVAMSVYDAIRRETPEGGSADMEKIWAKVRENDDRADEKED